MAYDENIYARIVSGELSPKEIEHLKGTGEWEEIQSILKATENLSLPSFDKEKGFEDLKGRRKPKTKQRNLRPYIYGIAASLLVLLSFIFLFTEEPTFIQAGMAENGGHTLPDGSKIILNDGSNIEYKNAEWANSRVLKLTGEAFFEVETGNKFLVNTSNGQVEVLGTKFNVRSWGDKLYVECYEGSVKVVQTESEVVLKANETVNFVNGKSNGLNTIEHKEPLWQSGTLRFHQEKLSEVFSEMERQYNVKIEFTLNDALFSGYFEEGNLNKALSQVCDPMGLEFNFIDDKTIVISD